MVNEDRINSESEENYLHMVIDHSHRPRIKWHSFISITKFRIWAASLCHRWTNFWYCCGGVRAAEVVWEVLLSSLILWDATVPAVEPTDTQVPCFSAEWQLGFIMAGGLDQPAGYFPQPAEALAPVLLCCSAWETGRDGDRIISGLRTVTSSAASGVSCDFSVHSSVLLKWLDSKQ